jgi:hypothetical protein
MAVPAAFLCGSIWAAEPAGVAPGAAGRIAALASKASPGGTVVLPPGIYLENARLPEGVSLAGTDPRTTLILGSVILTGSEAHPASLRRVTAIHDGGRSESLIECRGPVLLEQCLLISDGGFATVHLREPGEVTVRNCIVHGPRGDYALFARGQGRKLRVLNCHIEVHGFGVGLMDGASAEIRNCLVYGDANPAVMRTAADYALAYCNIGTGDAAGRPVLAGGGCASRDGSAAADPLERDAPKYEAAGLTFRPHPCEESRDIESYKRWLPSWAKGAGDPAPAYRDPDGHVNTLGAFGGPGGDWP